MTRMARIDQDQWSDTHDTLEDDNYEGHPQGIEEVEVHNREDGIPDRGVKISTDEDKEDSSVALESSRGPSLSTTGEHVSDAASVHSLPVVRITEADRSSTQRPSTSRTTESSPAPPPSPSRSAGDNVLTPQDRRHRHRSAIEVRLFHFSLRRSIV